MNTKKYIWSVYLLLWIYFLFLDSSYEQSDHIFTYLFFGWIPFLILQKLWKPVTTPSINEIQTITNPEPKQLTNEIDIDEIFEKIYKEHPEWKEKNDKK